jgi:branched-chain amino acid transport system permease protein
MTLVEFSNALVNGLLLGATYAGFALGLSVILGVLRVINIAHSAILVLGGLVYWQFVNSFGLDPLIAIAPVVVLFYLFGLVLHTGMAWRLSGESDSTNVLAYFGLMVAVESVAIVIWATDTRTVELGYLGAVVRFWQLNVPVAQLVTAGLTLALLLIFHTFLTRTVLGSAIRGIGQSKDVATLVGIDVRRLSRHVFALGIALAAFGGTVLGLNLPFTPQDHVRWLAWTFLVVLLGGVGSVRNILVSGALVGLIESLSGALLPSQYTYLVLYALLAGALLVRKEGLVSTQARVI